jgi:hypothetical protein
MIFFWILLGAVLYMTVRVYAVGGNQSAYPALVVSAARAVAREEGYYIPFSLSSRAHNPGNLEIGDQGLGTLGEGVTVFPNDDAGWNALYNNLSIIANGQSADHPLSMTWRDFGFDYSGGDANWSANVTNILGVNQDSTLGAYFNA